MINQISVKKGIPYPLGVSFYRKGINISVSIEGPGEKGICMKVQGQTDEIKLPFEKEYLVGNQFCIYIEGIKAAGLQYRFYCGDRYVTDPYGKMLAGSRYYGVLAEDNNEWFMVPSQKFVWENDKGPRLSYEDSIFYCTHVRGFTMHPSSKVRHKGTFAGIMEKIPYLKELGITTLELLPIYDFSEVTKVKKEITMEEAIARYRDLPVKEEVPKLNYWGFSKGYYYIPKKNYSASKDVIKELKTLVKTLHENQMELILQFYFDKTVRPYMIADILKYWMMEFHVDGFHLKGDKLPVEMLATDPVFAQTKLLYHDFPYDSIYGETAPNFRNLGSYTEDFMILMRRFLKGDSDTLNGFLYHQKRNPKQNGVINYMADYEGMRLWDMVSFERKHNEENGEDNRDGKDYNFTWNCGIEGVTKRTSVMELRKKQIKNALIFLFLAQGTPMIFGGDEFGNSQCGNNNPYCQDNELSWINWRKQKTNAEQFEFVKKLIGLRKSHPILRKGEEMRIMDYIACGYPDVSYHGEEAWRPDLNNYSHHVGIMYCGKYARVGRKEEDAFFYIAYNMHWEEHRFALPNLPKGLVWEEILCTDEKGGSEKSGNEKTENGKSDSTLVLPRSVKIFMSRKV